MFRDPRAKSWEKPTRLVRVRSSYLDVVLSEFKPHPITKSTVVITNRYYHGINACAANIIKENKLRVVNHGFVLKGLAITFKTQKDVAVFRMLYRDVTLVGKDCL